MTRSRAFTFPTVRRGSPSSSCGASPRTVPPVKRKKRATTRHHVRLMRERERENGERTERRDDVYMETRTEGGDSAHLLLVRVGFHIEALLHQKKRRSKPYRSHFHNEASRVNTNKKKIVSTKRTPLAFSFSSVVNSLLSRYGQETRIEREFYQVKYRRRRGRAPWTTMGGGERRNSPFSCRSKARRLSQQTGAKSCRPLGEGGWL